MPNRWRTAAGVTAVILALVALIVGLAYTAVLASTWLS